MDLTALINNSHPIVTVLVVAMAIFMPKLFNFIIHGKQMRRDEVDRLMEALRQRSDALERKVETLEKEVERWRSQYYELHEDHAEINAKCEVLLARVKELEEDLASRPCTIP